MAFVQLFRANNRPLDVLKRLQYSINFTNRRRLTLLRQTHWTEKEKKLFTCQTKIFNRFSREVRTISTLLRRSGHIKKAAITRQVADQIRCFSRSSSVLNRHDEDQGKQEKVCISMPIMVMKVRDNDIFPLGWVGLVFRFHILLDSFVQLSKI